VPNTRQLQDLSTALADLYAPGLAADNFVDRAFALTSRLVPLVLNSHGIIDATTGHLAANFDRHPAGLENAFEAFGALMHKYTPTRFDAATNGGRPFSVGDFYSKPALHDLDIYQEVYRPMGYRDHCFVHVRTDPGTTVFVGFFRDGGIFDENDKQLLEFLQPHLANARRLAFAATAASDIPLSPDLYVSSGFTPRECDVIHWLVQGKSNDEIASILRIRPDSVSRNLQSIYTKMGVDHRVAATLHALAIARQVHSTSLATRGGSVHLGVTTRASVAA
jgi:DNA-binding CsgD family transcriptional regulator